MVFKNLCCLSIGRYKVIGNFDDDEDDEDDDEDENITDEYINYDMYDYKNDNNCNTLKASLQL